jgi:cell division protein FtsB
LGISALVYFAYHTVQGDRGVLAWWNLHRQIQVSQAQLSLIEQDYNQLQKQVDLLRPNHLDPDMLEERARIMLNVGRENDVIIFHSRS